MKRKQAVSTTSSRKRAKQGAYLRTLVNVMCMISTVPAPEDDLAT